MPVTVAILGGGFMGQTHATGFRELGERARVKTICSRSTERARKVAESVGATFTTDFEAVLTDPELDAVDICLPTTAHREFAERAFAAGKHVLLEKPVALTVEDAEAIERAAEASGRTLMVALVLRFFADYEEIAQRVASGELGQPRAASAYRLSPPADWNDWMKDESQSGGTPVDLMIHDFDQTNLLLGEPRRVFARAAAGARGHVYAVVEYDEALAAVEGSMAMPGSYPFSAGIRILCENGVIEHGFRAAPAEDGGNIGTDVQSFLRVHPVGGATETVEVEGGDPWAREIAHFVDCLERGEPPERGTSAQSLAALRVSLATARSLESGLPEDV